MLGMITVFVGALVGLAAVVSADANSAAAAAVNFFDMNATAQQGLTREDYGIFLALLDLTGLEESMGNETLTLFVPTDAAFIATTAALEVGVLKEEEVVPGLVNAIEKRSLDVEDTLSTILLYHGVEGRLMAADVLSMTELKTLLPGQVIMRGGEDMEATQLGDAATSVRDPRIVATDFEEATIIAHFIDRVLIPESVAILLDLFVDVGAGVKPVASGTGCEYCEDDELCTATPWDKAATASCLPAPPMCYLSGERNKGSEGAEFVAYAPCCSGVDSVLAPGLGTGSWCLP